jgi:hypothetical protein
MKFFRFKASVGWRCAVAAASLALSACTSSQVHLVGVSDSDFPTDLGAPSFVEGRDIVDQLCAWANTNQISFPSQVVTSVYVDEIRYSGRSNTGASDILSVFLLNEISAKELLLFVGPDDIRGRPDLAVLAAAISAPGIWRFAKNDAECTSQEVMVRGYEGPSCVSVRAMSEAPDDLTYADFRQLIFSLSRGGVEDAQAVDVRILTLTRDHRIIGRTIEAWAISNPLDPINEQRACTPHLRAIAFESVG